ncbi:IclR family transcriptional regulator [Alginatibacterium sediminis]|uniref:IclR family transcriptional regulator n=1 Tax=Alginatibacterium sediminis TaxID=2164068 RepID=A0A420E8C9_9ALTE|nr:IclR family transcriptional regulator [Alginatibacterium sediminis]RKF15574.1 IclR family transcriptional regulator [Alginatibacterium sediminis]
MAQNKAEYRAPALEKALDILELLSQSKRPLTKKEISERLEKTVNEIFRMLEVLKVREYVLHDEVQGTYELSLKMFEMSNLHLPMKRVLKSAAPELVELSELVQQSCHLSVYDRGNMLVVARQESPYKMGFSLSLGARIDIFGSGSGIVMLAFTDEESRTKRLDSSGASRKEKAFVLQEVEKTMRLGFYVGESPQVSGLTNISLPILSLHGEANAVLTIPYLTLNAMSLHHQVVDREQVIVYAQRSAQRLTKVLGGKWHLPEV